jgi:tetratricopeptide (TPR) repeat protein
MKNLPPRSAHRLPALLVMCLLSFVVRAEPPNFEAELLGIQSAWAQANYQVPTGAAREQAFDRLAQQAAAFSEKYPRRAEPLIWEGIVLSTFAGVKGGLGALGLAKQARDRLEAALKIDPQALAGSAHTSLGTLYHKVPGFPLSFGSDKKARTHLEQALKMNPDGIDPNYLYAEFLYDEGEYAEARRHLGIAGRAADRPGREVADAGRRAEIRDLLAKLN